jgi:mono/diheme cytochrome c family protein
MIGKIIGFLVAVALAIAIGAAIIVLLVMPRLYWGAIGKPSRPERWIAHYVLGNWVRGNAAAQQNPIPPTPENLKAGEQDYDHHCAFCHGLDGSARNQPHADFYPPIARLQDVSDMSNGEIYYIVANGIRMTAMPGFGATHTPDEIWRMILWVRHFPHLTPQERAAIEAKMAQAGTTNERATRQSPGQTMAPAPNR